MHSTLLDRTTAPLAIGEVAPDFDLHRFTGKRRWLSDYRGSPVVVAFHPPRWDPALADQIERYKASVALRLDEPVAETFLVRNDELSAMRFGVDGASAVFVVDAGGMIAWRYVAGVDPLPNIDDEQDKAVALRAKHDARCNRREFLAVGFAAALAILLSTIAASTSIGKRVRELPMRIEKFLL